VNPNLGPSTIPSKPEDDPMPDDATLNFEVRPTCAKCERLAVVYDDTTPLCGRHATIFMVDFTSGESTTETDGGDQD
jgi:hypothetical protein